MIDHSMWSILIDEGGLGGELFRRDANVDYLRDEGVTDPIFPSYSLRVAQLPTFNRF